MEIIRGSTATVLPEENYSEEVEEFYTKESNEIQSPVLIARTKRARNRKVKTSLVIKASFVLMIGLLLVFRAASITKLGYSVSKNKDTYTQINNENTLLETEISKKMSLSEIEQIAKQRLGMQLPQGYQLVKLSVSTVDETNTLSTNDNNTVQKDLTWYEKIIKDVTNFLGMI